MDSSTYIGSAAFLLTGIPRAPLRQELNGTAAVAEHGIVEMDAEESLDMEVSGWCTCR